MPTVAGVRVDRPIKELVDTLERFGAVVTRHENQLKVTNPDGDRSTILPVRSQGRSSMYDVLRRLKAIGLGGDQPEHEFEIGKTRIDDNGDVHIKSSLGKIPPILGFEFSTASSALIEGLMDSLAQDIAGGYAKRLAAEGENAQWQELAETAERELEKVRTERKTAVTELVAQRDEAREQLAEANKKLSDMKAGLKLLGINLPIGDSNGTN